MLLAQEVKLKITSKQLISAAVGRAGSSVIGGSVGEAAAPTHVSYKEYKRDDLP